MSITSLRPVFRTDARPVSGPLGPLDAAQPSPNDAQFFGITLLRAGKISSDQLMAAMRARKHAHLLDSLISLGAIPAGALYTALAAHWNVGYADLHLAPPDAALIARADVVDCLRGAWVPWRALGQTTVIACAYPEDFAARRAALTAIFGPVVLAVAPRAAIESALLLRAGPALVRRAETRVPAADSCRNYRPQRLLLPLLALVLALLLIGYAAPKALFLGVMCLSLLVMYAQTALKILAILPRRTRQTPSADLLLTAPPSAAALTLSPPPLRLITPLPTISIMVALYRESRMVSRLIRRLEQLEYPRDLLDVVFVIEDNDTATATALNSVDLPNWLRVLPVPTGTIRTKPRALNYGLDHCRGSIIGVYDAEDAPAADQLRIVAKGFAAGGPRLACLQGRLDYYNPHTNWLARCFTIEYAAWWRIFLPGIERLGLAIPLGGTTLFFRRDALLDLGGWDAHNVTEDADLGLRIARRGYSTQLINTVTMEEANCRTLPWIKQRSRWIKGYMITWATHMRDPGLLLRELGLRRFIGFQVMFAGSILQALLAPLMWALWLAPLGLFDPALVLVPHGILVFLAAMGVLTEALLMGCNLAGVLKTNHKIRMLWLPTMLIYAALSSFAAYKALWEMLSAPFYWDKTSHGIFDS